MQEENSIIQRELDGHTISHRLSDGYINLAEVFELTEAKFGNWKRLKAVKAHLSVLSEDIGIPIASTGEDKGLIIYTYTDYKQLVWGHPMVVIFYLKSMVSSRKVENSVIIGHWIAKWSLDEIQKQTSTQTEMFTILSEALSLSRIASEKAIATSRETKTYLYQRIAALGGKVFF